MSNPSGGTAEGSETLVLLHGSANGSYSWGPIQRGLQARGANVVAPDMLGYGKAPPPSAAWNIGEETQHLVRALEPVRGEPLHLVTHSLGTMFGLYLLRALGTRVTRLTLIDPVVVSVLAEFGEHDALAEMEGQYQSFTRLMPNNEAAARGFVEFWSGPGAWEKIGEKGRSAISALAPKVQLEMRAARSDKTPLATIVPSSPPTTILLGERTRIAPRAVARQFAKAFKATVTEVPGAGHMIPLTHPAAIVDFLRPVEPSNEVNNQATARRWESHG